MNEILTAGLIGGLLGGGLGYGLRFLIGRTQSAAIEQKARARLKEAERESAAVLKEANIQARAEVVKAREEFELTTKTRRKELSETEKRLTLREDNLDRKMVLLEKKEQSVQAKQEKQEQLLKDLTAREQKLESREKVLEDRQQRLAGMTREGARLEILTRMENEVHGEIGGLLRRRQQEAREQAEREAQRIVCMAVQRYSASHASEMMTSTVPLSGDDIKGRIIGREGRNIRALEAETGVNMLVDDTPEAVVISAFDPIRREVARQSLEMLVADGRIHPARIEEVVAKVRENVDSMVRSSGEEAAYKAGIQNVDPELLFRLGRLKFRSSYAQNVLMHSLEVAHLMGLMAGEVGLDPELARRIGLFHDIGKSLDHEVEGGHATIGADLLKRFGETDPLINAVAAHHEEVEPQSLYAVLCSAADAISSSRPGARSESTEFYIQRLEKLEEIADSFEGVRKTFAIQAGREIRVMVDPNVTDDNAAMTLARDISKRIESELRYPGQVRVVVIREKRCVEYAR